MIQYICKVTPSTTAFEHIEGYFTGLRALIITLTHSLSAHTFIQYYGERLLLLGSAITQNERKHNQERERAKRGDLHTHTDNKDKETIMQSISLILASIGKHCGTAELFKWFFSNFCTRTHTHARAKRERDEEKKEKKVTAVMETQPVFGKHHLMVYVYTMRLCMCMCVFMQQLYVIKHMESAAQT